jgi:Xaa-Pro aminopeptidase
MPEQHQQRRARLAAILEAEGLSNALVTSSVNVRYLSGFTGSSGALLVGADGLAVLATDGRYELQSAAECPDVRRLITRAGRRELGELALQSAGSRVGFEDQHLSVAAWQGLPSHERWQPFADSVDRLREVKDETELNLLRQASAATDHALGEVLSLMRPGVTERQVARWIDDRLRDAAEGPGFDTIVASGPNGAIPHHQPTDRVIGAGDLVTIDVGARLAGYHADMTRTVLVGGAAVGWQRDVHDAVKSSQAAGVAALRPGRTAREVDAEARAVLADAELDQLFTHGLGHGVGLQIHEAPYLGVTSTDKLQAAVPVTVEPGVYLPGRGGVRIEDTVVVHADHVETLTTTTRDLLVLG